MGGHVDFRRERQFLAVWLVGPKLLFGKLNGRLNIDNWGLDRCKARPGASGSSVISSTARKSQRLHGVMKGKATFDRSSSVTDCSTS